MRAIAMVTRRGCVLLLVMAAGCAPAIHHAPRTNAAAEQTLAYDRLYFGRSMPGGDTVSEEDWGAFLRDVVTPLFPQGLTAWNAHGQWRNGDGGIIREQTFVLELIHPPGTEATAEANVARIIGEYRTRFQQESVMRVRDRVRVSFQAG